MSTSTVDSPLLTNTEAKAFFRIKDKEAWRKFQREYKIPYMRMGSRKLFNKDVLEKVAVKAMEATARKVYP